MYGGLMGEDAYWERRREEFENPRAFHRRSQWEDDEPEYAEGSLFLDEEIEDIEAEKGYPMAELDEGDLLDIVEDIKGIEADSAVWNVWYSCIDYKYQIA
ncbi:MAG: hypothetical protein LIO94_06880 [Clostridiales bacterium]|nr:hypothetical protein [Clostridiales bacterium]